MVYKLVSDQLLHRLERQIACIKAEPTAASYTPTSSSDTSGVVGEITYDADFLYIKISATAWRRIALSSF